MSTVPKNPFPPIIYEDENYLVINKPAGIAMHPSEQEMLIRLDKKAAQTITISDLVLEKYPKMKDVGEPMEVNSKDGVIVKILRPGIVHRLDKGTTGCVIIAKTQEAFLFLKAQFMEHKVIKTYRAFTYGTPAVDEGKIIEPIGRSRANIRKWATGKSARGELREAVTMYRVIARIGIKEGSAKGSTQAGTFAYIEATPKTGRTHQIRVHLNYMNYPIVCDNLYAPKRPPALGFERLALHAHTITFDGVDGKRISVEAPFPQDFISAIKIAEKGEV